MSDFDDVDDVDDLPDLDDEFDLDDELEDLDLEPDDDEDLVGLEPDDEADDEAAGTDDVEDDDLDALAADPVAPADEDEADEPRAPGGGEATALVEDDDLLDDVSASPLSAERDLDVDDEVREGEFVCRSCFMAKRESALADEDAQLCRDCV